MRLIEGKKIAADIRAEIKEDTERRRAEGKTVPGLVVILVGDDPASHAYVRGKGKACEEIGYLSKIETRPASITQEELLDLVNAYNNDDDYHGILVQMPLPDHIDEKTVIHAVDPKKDVDGFHPINVGNLMIGDDALAPCTPSGIQELLARYDIPTKGKHLVVVGRSNIVGKPTAALMVQKKERANAIVTVCHSAAEDLAAITRSADILVAAIGRAEFVTADMVKEGAVVIDVGMNRVEDASKKRGYRLTGDVDFENVSKKASYITPVPGGVGPMTIAMLMSNTMKACKQIVGE
jgi:methylenetetrahydrofolate dehydrogenase (NADP+)/methenyltetrahydrofolate cyclohydrolase